MSHPFLVEVTRLDVGYIARISDRETGLVVHSTAPKATDVETRKAARQWIRTAEKNGGGKGKVTPGLPRGKAGVCRVCGCTEDKPCYPPCAWTDRSRPLCTACIASKSRGRSPVSDTGFFSLGSRGGGKGKR